MSIKTIIFDQGKVVIDHDNEMMYKNLSEFSPLGRNSFKERIKNTNSIENYVKGKIDSEDFWKRLSTLTEMDIDYKEFEKVFCLHMSRKEDMEKLIRELAQDYELFLLSNTNELHQRWGEKNCPVMNCFDEKILSFEVGSRKPETKIFEITLERTQSEPEECVYTDDLKEYVKIAEDLNMHGIWFKDKEQLKSKLKNLGVKLGAH